MLEWLLKRKDLKLGDRLSGRARMVSTGTGGLLGGTHVASNLGWRPVEALAVGDQVLTFDHGMQPITALYRETLVTGADTMGALRAPVYIPADALNNRAPMWVMPDQGLLVESDVIDAQFGDPFAVLPACTLDGYRGISRVRPGERMELVLPRFAQDQVVYVEAGALGYCPAERDILDFAFDKMDEAYRVLSVGDARALVVDMMAEDDRIEQGMSGVPFPIRTDGFDPMDLR